MTRKRLKIVASGTLFFTHSINVPGDRTANGDAKGSTTVLRAQSVSRSRGGSASTILSVLCQFNPPQQPHTQSLRSRGEAAATAYVRSATPQEPVIETWLVAPIGRGSEANALLGDLEREGVRTKLCARREGEGVPSAYVLKTLLTPKDSTTKPKIKRTVINYNPIPDLTHEEFIRLLSPLLYPISTPTSSHSLSPPNRSPTSPETRIGEEAIHVPSLEPPFDWFHFEGRTAQTTLSNMTGLDGFARDRGWRARMVFSLDCMRAGRPGQDALIPHADVVFFSKSYARSHLFSSPRAFLLSQALRAAPHALLIVSWADQGSALLSVPTKEYFQSSKFVVDKDGIEEVGGEFESVRSSTVTGSGIGSGTVTRSSAGRDGRDGGSGSGSGSAPAGRGTTGLADADITERRNALFDEDDDGDDDDVIDESGADDAFVAGMIYALSRRVLPNPMFSPIPAQPSQPNQNTVSSATTQPKAANAHLTPPEDDLEKGRWKLEECLRFATEMAGRKMRIKGFAGLARAMENVGWFND
ncbi:hypothetical protein FRB99_004253 [Tulasnella sp. 403]|nr:hypothetical protein FRB99_004253 [Tulasnella sp. 403]